MHKTLRTLFATALTFCAMAASFTALAGKVDQGVLSNGITANGAVLSNGIAVNGIIANGAVLSNGIAANGINRNGVRTHGAALGGRPSAAAEPPIRVESIVLRDGREVILDRK
jgi:hypothetical protein